MRHQAAFVAIVILLSISPFASAQSAGPLLGSPDFKPSDTNPVGWRGDGTGRFPGATPPTEWSRWPKGFGDLRCITNPKNVLPMPNGVIANWLVLGPFECADAATAIDAPWVADEAKLQPTDGAKAGDPPTPKATTGASTRPDEASAKSGKTWTPEWARSGKVSMNPSGEELSTAWDDKKDNAANAFYACARVAAKGAMKVRLPLGLDEKKGRGKVYVNGQPVAAAKDGKSYPFELAAGDNTILVKVAGQARITPRLAPGDDAPMDTKNILWTLKIPELDSGANGTSSPIVVGDRIYMTVEPMGLMCVSRADGKIVWLHFNNFYDALSEPAYAGIADDITALDADLKAAAEIASAGASPEGLTGKSGEPLAKAMEKVKTSFAKINDQVKKAGKGREWGRHDGGMSGPTPTCDGKFVYALYPPGLVVCYDMDGKRIWSKAVNSGGAPEHGNTASPVLIGGKIIMMMGGGLIALDAKTGETAWTAKGGEGHGSLLRVRAGSSDMVYLPWPAGIAFNAKDGSTAWSSKDRYMDVHNNWTSPTVSGDTIYIQDINDWHGTCSVIALKFSANSSGSVAGQIGKRIAAPDKLGCPNSSPLFDNGLVYCFTKVGRIAAFDVQGGAFVYEKLLPMYPNQGWVFDPGATASPALAGKNIYLTDDHFNTVVVKPGKSFESVAVNAIWSADYITSTPVFAGANIYMRGYDYLYAIGSK